MAPLTSIIHKIAKIRTLVAVRMSSEIVYRIAPWHGPERDTFEGEALKDVVANTQGLTGLATYKTPSLEVCTDMKNYTSLLRDMRDDVHSFRTIAGAFCHG